MTWKCSLCNVVVKHTLHTNKGMQFCDWRLSAPETDSTSETFAYHDEDSVDIYAGLQDSPEKNTNTGKNCPCVLIQWGLIHFYSLCDWQTECSVLLFEECHFSYAEILLGSWLCFRKGMQILSLSKAQWIHGLVWRNYCRGTSKERGILQWGRNRNIFQFYWNILFTMQSYICLMYNLAWVGFTHPNSSKAGLYKT